MAHGGFRAHPKPVTPPRASDERMRLKHPNSIHPSYQSASHSSSSHDFPARTPSSDYLTMPSPGMQPTPPVSHHPSRRINPFEYHTPMDTYEKIKVGLMCLLGVPLVRIVLAALVGLVIAIICTIAVTGHRLRCPRTGKKQPLPLWRKALIAPVPYLVRFVLFIVGFYWIKVTNAPRPADLPRLIVSNHISFIDGIFFTWYLFPSIAMKKELASIPFLGNILKSLTPILIDRRTSEGRRKAMDAITEHVNSPQLPPLFIFPEGTTSNQDYLTKFKVGSFTGGLPCLPVAIKYPYKHFDLSWTPGVSAAHLAFRLLCQFYNRMEVEFLPVYIPSEQEKQLPDLYAENVRQVMAKALNVQCANHAFEDIALLLEVGSYVEHHVISITDVNEIKSLTALRGTDVDKLVKYFERRDIDGDGKLSKQELKNLFPDEDDRIIDRFFELIDLDGNGQIDFRELCLGLRALNPKFQSPERLARFAFKLYDTDGDGVIYAYQLEEMLRFTQRFYGASPEAMESAIEQWAGEHDQPVSFQTFQELIEKQPELLMYAKSRLEVLRGSFRDF